LKKPRIPTGKKRCPAGGRRTATRQNTAAASFPDPLPSGKWDNQIHFRRQPATGFTAFGPGLAVFLTYQHRMLVGVGGGVKRPVL